MDPCRKIIFVRPDGLRRRGRLGMRWLDFVEEDIRASGVTVWRRRAKEREEWKKVVKAVMT